MLNEHYVSYYEITACWSSERAGVLVCHHPTLRWLVVLSHREKGRKMLNFRRENFLDKNEMRNRK